MVHLLSNSRKQSSDHVIYCEELAVTKDRYTRSTNAGKGKRSAILETKSDVSNEFTKSIRVSEEGTYEVVAIRDRFCGATSHTTTPSKNRQQLLTFG